MLGMELVDGAQDGLGGQISPKAMPKPSHTRVDRPTGNIFAMAADQSIKFDTEQLQYDQEFWKGTTGNATYNDEFESPITADSPTFEEPIPGITPHNTQIDVSSNGEQPMSDTSLFHPYYQHFLPQHDSAIRQYPRSDKSERMLSALALTLKSIQRADDDQINSKVVDDRGSAGVDSGFVDFAGFLKRDDSKVPMRSPPAIPQRIVAAATAVSKSDVAPPSRTIQASDTVINAVHNKGKRISIASSMQAHNGRGGSPVKTPFPFPTVKSTSSSRDWPGNIKPTLDATALHLLRHSEAAQDLRNGTSSPSAAARRPSGAIHDAVLTLTLCRRYAPNGRRISRLLIPADAELTVPVRKEVMSEAAETDTENKTHFANLEFDDAALFRQLRHAYQKELLGTSRVSRWWCRWASARVLQRIVIVTIDEPGGLPWHMDWAQRPGGPHSPRFLARKGLSDTFGEENLLRHFWSPAMGRARYTWVHWAHRVARDLDEVYEDEQAASQSNARHRNLAAVPGGLEFIEGWSVVRILIAVGFVTALSVAVVVLWVFCGTSVRGVAFDITTTSREMLWRKLAEDSHGRYDVTSSDLGSMATRVQTGLVLGLLVLLFGWMGVVSWALVSWLVM